MAKRKRKKGQTKIYKTLHPVGFCNDGRWVLKGNVEDTRNIIICLNANVGCNCDLVHSRRSRCPIHHRGDCLSYIQLQCTQILTTESGRFSV